MYPAFTLVGLFFTYSKYRSFTRTEVIHVSVLVYIYIIIYLVYILSLYTKHKYIKSR
jgi:hypothetical protein